MNDLERKCHNFILQCYFGDMENPIDAAINRAYVDMASHTLKGFAEHQYQEKWKLRFEASSKIKKALDLLDAESDYTSWHCELCGELQKVYTEKRLSYGQAQKWVNMTTKYLQVFAVIFKSIDDDEGLSKIPEFFWNAANIKKLHIPLDRYIMEAYNIGSFGPWSKLNDKQYAECCARTGGKTLEDELADWGEIAKKHRADNHKSYAYFVENKKK